MPVGAESFSARPLRCRAQRSSHTLKGCPQEEAATTQPLVTRVALPPRSSRMSEARRGDPRSHRETCRSHAAGEEIALALDPASSEFYSTRRRAATSSRSPTRASSSSAADGCLLGRLGATVSHRLHRRRLSRRRLGWLEATSPTKMGDRMPARRRRSLRDQQQASAAAASKQKCVANSILIKVNQIGTITETMEAIELAPPLSATPRSSRTAQARRRTPSSRTSPLVQARDRSRPAQPQPHGPHRQVQPVAAH